MTEAIETREAVYFFIPEILHQGEVKRHTGNVRVTKLVRKGQKGYDQSTTCSKAVAQQWADALHNTAVLEAHGLEQLIA
mgnify:CR=1 FL=1